MKTLKWLTYALMAALLSCGMVACGDDDPEEFTPGNNDGNDNNHNDKPNDVLSVPEQKEKLEQTSINLLEKIDAQDFKDIDDLAQYAQSEYVDKSNTEAVSNWFKECLDAVTQKTGEGVRNDWGYEYYAYNYTRIIELSNFTGHFEVANGKWNYTKANDLQFLFSDEQNNPCKISVTSKGQQKKVYAGEDEDDWRYEYDQITGSSKEEVDLIKYYIYVPEEVNVVLSRNGEILVSATIHPNLNDMKGEDFDIYKDSYDVTAEIKIHDYVLTVDKAHYNPNKCIEISTKFTKGQETLISAKASCSGKISENEDFNEIGEVNLYINILNQIQFKGNISNWDKFYNNYEKAESYYDEEQNFKSYLNNANEYLDAKMYFNSDVKQAEFKFIANCDQYYGGEEWYAEPAIFFEDGTSYNTLEAFFDKDDFKKLIHAFDDFVAGFENFGIY